MAGPGGLVEAREGRGWRPSGGRGHQSWDPTPLERAGGNPPGTRLDRTAPRGTAQYANPKVFPDYLEIDRPPHTHSVYQMYHPEARPKVPIGVVAASSKATSPEPERIKQSYLTPAHPGLSPAQEAAGLYYREITPAELISIFLKLPGAAQVALVRNLRAINHFRGDLGKNIDNAKWSFIGAAYNEQFYANLITQELGSQANTAVHTAAENLARKTKRAATLVTQTAKRELPKTPAYLREQLAATIRYFQNILTNPSAREQGGYFTAAQGLRAGAFATEVVTVAGCAIMPFLPLAPKSPTSASATLVECVGEDKLNAQALQDALTHEQQLVRDYGDNFAVTESHTDGSSYLDIAIRTKDGSTLPVARVAESSVDPTVTCVSLINPKATGESNNPFLVFWRKIKSKDESLVRMFQRLFGTSASDAGGEFLSAILPAASPPPDATETAASSTPTSAPDTSTPTLAPSPTATETLASSPTATATEAPTLAPPKPTLTPDQVLDRFAPNIQMDLPEQNAVIRQDLKEIAPYIIKYTRMLATYDRLPATVAGATEINAALDRIYKEHPDAVPLADIFRRYSDNPIDIFGNQIESITPIPPDIQKLYPIAIGAYIPHSWSGGDIALNYDDFKGLNNPQVGAVMRRAILIKESTSMLIALRRGVSQPQADHMGTVMEILYLQDILKNNRSLSASDQNDIRGRISVFIRFFADWTTPISMHTDAIRGERMVNTQRYNVTEETLQTYRDVFGAKKDTGRLKL